MVDLFIRGGVFMYPIAVCSIITLAIVIERIWMLRRGRIIPEEFIRNVEELLRKRKVSEAVFMCQGHTSSIARVFLGGLKNSGRGMWLVKEGIEEMGAREAVTLERHVGALATISNLTPLLGLLGTVSGMIKTFNVISVQGVGNPAPLAGGIAEALITTASGLCVAIPTLVCHRVLKDRVERLIFEMEDHSMKFIEILEGAGKGPNETVLKGGENGNTSPGGEPDTVHQ